MDTLTPVSACRYITSIHLTTTQPTEFIDLTERVQQLIARAELRFGIVNVQTLHTTTAVVVNEHEPLLLADFQSLLEAAAPSDGRYQHDDTSARTVNLTDAERPNGHAHCRALLLPASVCLTVTSGRLLLGRWQRVFFVELDGPRERDVSVLIFGEAAR
jgi:secondary thiamine-phosphate synthase enzyme